jgi:hypothetical protein
VPDDARPSVPRDRWASRLRAISAQACTVHEEELAPILEESRAHLQARLSAHASIQEAGASEGSGDGADDRQTSEVDTQAGMPVAPDAAPEALPLPGGAPTAAEGASSTAASDPSASMEDAQDAAPQAHAGPDPTPPACGHCGSHDTGFAAESGRVYCRNEGCHAVDNPSIGRSHAGDRATSQVMNGCSASSR